MDNTHRSKAMKSASSRRTPAPAIGAAVGIAALVTITLSGCGDRARETDAHEKAGGSAPVLHEPLAEEIHLGRIRQLTFGGENAEAYFSFAGEHLIFQSTRGDHACDRIYTMRTDGSELRLVSTGTGRTTCAYFFPGDQRILYASTHAAGADCPPVPDYSLGYVWPVYASYDLYAAAADGSEPRLLTDTPGYDAEATIGPDGTIVFTSTRDGDLDLYRMAADGSDVRRLTHEVGYDGGAFFSADGSRIVYRAHHPEDPAEIADYQRLLAAEKIRPGNLEIFVMDADGGNKRQVTSNGAANFCPFFHPSGERIIFASNLHDPDGRNFELYLIDVDGSGLERVTYHPSFDGFPMWSPDGKQLAWCSNRATPPGARDTNVFIADWIEPGDAPR